MKKFYFIAFGLLFSLPALSQEFQFSPQKHQVYTVTNTDFNEVNVDITLDSAQDLSLDWKVLENTMPQAWSYSLCDYMSCYVGIPDSGSMMSITKAEMQTGTIPFFKLTMMIGKNDYSSGMVKIYFYDKNDMSRGDTISFQVSYAQPSSVALPSNTSLLVYPNPSSGKLNLSADIAKFKSYKVYNLLGKQITENVLDPNQNKIDLSALAKGSYFIEFMQSNGTPVRQKILLQ